MNLPPLSDKELAALRSLSTCEIANAIELLGIRLRNEGFMDSRVRSIFPDFGPVVGYAVTVKIKCSSPSTDGQNYLERTEWWNEILRTPAPRIVVIEDVDMKPGTGALIGAVHANLLKALKCSAVITNGAVRDLPQVRAIPFHLFAGNVAVSHAYAHMVEMRTPVKIGGLTVEPGDLLHADCHGVISVPKSEALSIPALAAKRREQEEELIQMCDQPNPSIEDLRAKIRDLRN